MFQKVLNLDILGVLRVMKTGVKARLDELRIEVDHSLRVVVDAIIEEETGMQSDAGVKMLSDAQVRAIVEKARTRVRNPPKK